ncbi:hypothetical protein [Amorphus sp. MBR-141]
MSKSPDAQIAALGQGLILANSALIQIYGALNELRPAVAAWAGDDFRQRMDVLDDNISRMQEILADLSENVGG